MAESTCCTRHSWLKKWYTRSVRSGGSARAWQYSRRLCILRRNTIRCSMLEANVEAAELTTNDMSTVPRIMYSVAYNSSASLSGTTSPYPIVVIVMTAQ
jgi:hypothetical protein